MLDPGINKRQGASGGLSSRPSPISSIRRNEGTIRRELNHSSSPTSKLRGMSADAAERWSNKPKPASKLRGMSADAAERWSNKPKPASKLRGMSADAAERWSNKPKPASKLRGMSADAAERWSNKPKPASKLRGMSADAAERWSNSANRSGTYNIRSGDTLSAIAQRELGFSSRWREIKKPDGSNFSASEAGRLRIGQQISLPGTSSSTNNRSGGGNPKLRGMSADAAERWSNKPKPASNLRGMSANAAERWSNKPKSASNLRGMSANAAERWHAGSSLKPKQTPASNPIASNPRRYGSADAAERWHGGRSPQPQVAIVPLGNQYVRNCPLPPPASKPPKPEPKKHWWDKAGNFVQEKTSGAWDKTKSAGKFVKDRAEDFGHTALDVGGMIPVAGAAFDGANAVWYLAKGDKVNAAFSAASAVPFIGDAAMAAKYGAKAVKGAEKLAEAGTTVNRVTNVADKGVEGVANIAAKAEKTPWWTRPDPGSNYVTDEQGRTILAVHRIDGVQPVGRRKEDLRRMKIPGMKPGDHKGHFGAEGLVRDRDRVNTPFNIAGESRNSNLSAKKKFENLAGRIKQEHPDSKIYTAHEPLYRGQGSRPVASTHSIMNDKGEILHSETILNKEKFERHVAPD